MDMSPDRSEKSGSALRAVLDAALLVPADQRHFVVPGGKGGFGQANVCYALDSAELPKQASWINDALKYIEDNALGNVLTEPVTESDASIATIISSAIARAAGFQSHPRIRRAIEIYAMDWAMRHMTRLG